MAKIKKWVVLDKDDTLWLHEAYPNASLSLTLALLLKSFRMAHQVTPAELVLKGAQALKDTL